MFNDLSEFPLKTGVSDCVLTCASTGGGEDGTAFIDIVANI